MANTYAQQTSNAAVFVANLESKHERVEVLERGSGYKRGKALCAYYRHGHMCNFVAGPAQLKKILAGKGKVTITRKMIFGARYVDEGHGWS